MTNLEKTIKQLEKEATAARPGDMSVSKHLLYSNKDTGTAVYEVLTSNGNIVRQNGCGEYITWSYYLVGDNNGFTDSNLMVQSEARVSLEKITETETKVIIPRSGYQTIHFGVKIPVENLEFEKNKFKPYTEIKK